MKYIVSEIIYYLKEIFRRLLRKPRGVVILREKVLLNEKMKEKRLAGIKIRKIFTKNELKFVLINGKKKKSRYRLRRGDIVEYVKAPEGDFVAEAFQVVVGAVLLTAGILTGNPALVAVGTGLIIGGAVSVLTRLLFPPTPPEVGFGDAEGKGSSQPPEIKGANNTISRSVLPFLFGTTIQTPFYGQFPYRLIEDGTPTNKYRQYFIANYDYVNISNEKIGETKVTDFSSSFLTIIKSQGGSFFIGFGNVKPIPRDEQLSVDTSEIKDESSAFTYNVVASGSTIKYDFILEFTNVDILNFPQKEFKVEIDIEIFGPSNKTVSETFLINSGDLVLVGGTTYRYTGTKTWTEPIIFIYRTRFFPVSDTRISAEEVENEQDVIIVEEELTAGVYANTVTLNNPINKYPGIPSQIIQTSPDNTIDIDLIIGFPAGLFKQQSDGSRTARTATVNVQYKTQIGSYQALDTATLYVRDVNGVKQPLSSSTTTVSGSIITFHSPDNIAQADELFFRTIGMTLSADKYTIKVESADLFEKTDSDIGYPVMSEFNFYIDDDVLDESILPNVNQISVDAIAYGSLSGTLRQYNYIGKSELPIWNGTNWSTSAETRNPASIIRFLLTSELVNPRAESVDNIDNDSLVELYDWCVSESYFVDGIVSEPTKILELIQTLLSNVQASFTFFNGQYFFVIDDPSKEPIDMFTQHNSFNFKWIPQIGQLTTALRIGFINNTDYSQDEITLYWYNDTVNLTPEGGTSDVDYQIIKTDYKYLTDESSVIKLGTYALTLIQTKRNAFEYGVNLEALSLKKFDRVWVSNTTDLTNESTGLIKEIILSGENLIGFKLYSKIEIAKNSIITIRSLDFTNELPQIKVFNVLNNGFTDTINITPIVYDGNIRGKGEITGIQETWIYDGDTFDLGVEPIFECVIMNIRYNDDMTATITAREA